MNKNSSDSSHKQIDTRLEDLNLAPHATPSCQAIRYQPGKISLDIRPPFFRDCDRIIHTLSYSRYVDKTQVFSLTANDHITHRSLHVQFVSRIGRTIGRALHLNEDLIEAVALGHDIGHPPFGHEGEAVLDRICRSQGIGRFHHNAQSMRFLMEIENRGAGINLTVQTLDGILCHNGELLQESYQPDLSKTPQILLEQYHRLFTGELEPAVLRPMTMEGCVVRISDVIAYIGRDIEDAIRLGLINRDQIPESVREQLGNSNSRIIETLVNDLIYNSSGKETLNFSKEVFKALDALFKFNYKMIYTNPVIKVELPKIERIIHMLYDFYLDKIKTSQIEKAPGLLHYLNGMEKTYHDNNTPERLCIDFIAGMTDDYLTTRFQQLFLPAPLRTSD